MFNRSCICELNAANQMRWKTHRILKTSNMKHLHIILILFLLSMLSACSKTTFVALKSTGKTIRLGLKDSRLTKKEIITYNYEKHPFVLSSGQILLPCTIDGTADTLFFDTGYNGSLHEYISSPDSFPMKPILTQSTTTFSGTIWEKKGLSVHTVETPWVSIKNHVCMVSCNNFHPKEHCTGKSRSDYRMVGLQTLPNYYQTLCLNFSDTTIQLLDSNTLYDTTGYHHVPALFTSRDGRQNYIIPFITLQIDSQNVDFLFDTGAGICLAVKGYAAHAKENDIAFTGRIGRDASGIVTDTTHIQSAYIPTFGQDTDAVWISYMEHISHHVMGLDFISCYDWIIDRNNKAVFAKRIANKSWNIHEIPLYGVGMENDTTLMIHRAPYPNTNGYPVGAIILAVNGEKICRDNICEMKHLLNSTPDWSKLAITIKQPENK